MDTFLLKKIMAPFFFPLSLCFELLFIGLFLLWFTRRQKAGKVLVCLGIVLLMLCSYPPLPDIFLRSLEYKYPPLVDVTQCSDIQWVVVLGGGHRSDSKLPVTSQLSEASLSRFVEGARIHKLLPESRLLLSGGAVFDPVPEARVMAGVAEIMGIGENEIIVEELSRDTGDQARFIHEIVGDEKLILVTSASHMPRSMALFRKRGMNPIPAPTDYWIKESQGLVPGAFFPSTTNFRKIERALYEYLGLGWARLSGQT